ncbi:MAG: CpsD/CapB family tyrosine-protein kinase [Atopobiaceae bacterium]|jgi:capsular exopolysaccharide synthesis family protein
MPKLGKFSSDAEENVYLLNAAKTLATNIRFASIDRPIKSIAVTSSVPNEGKSTVSVLLAQAMAQGNRRVLIIDGDLRRRTLGGLLSVHGSYGLYAVLSRQATLQDAIVQVPQYGFSFLDVEPRIPNPVDILQSRHFKNLIKELEKSYDFVILDTPPLSTFVDAAVASQAVDGTVLVARREFVRKDELAAAYEQLQKANANVLGVVLNYCASDKSEYYYNYYGKDGKSSKKHTKTMPTTMPTTVDLDEQERVMAEDPQDAYDELQPVHVSARAVKPNSYATGSRFKRSANGNASHFN